MGNRTRDPERKICYLLVEEGHVKLSSYNSLLPKQWDKTLKFIFGILGSCGATAKGWNSVWCFPVYLPLLLFILDSFYINSLIFVCTEQGHFDPRLRHARSYNSVNSFQEVTIVSFAATLHLSNKLSSEPLFWALECLPASFLRCETWSVLVSLDKGM